MKFNNSLKDKKKESDYKEEIYIINKDLSEKKKRLLIPQ